MINRRKFVVGNGLAATGIALAPSAFSQSGKTLKIVVGFPAGGPVDAVARLLAEYSRADYGGAIVVENRAGAAGRLAVSYVQSAKPDGTTVLFSPNIAFTMYPHVFSKTTYNLDKDFIPISNIYRFPYSVSVGPAVPASVRTLADYVSWAKTGQARLVYGVPSAGATPHFLGQMLARQLGLDLSSVPYKGGAPLAQDLMGGQVPMAIQVASDVVAYAPTGKVRSLAISGASRLPFLKEVPTLSELGYPDLVVEDGCAIYLPAQTPPDVVKSLDKIINDATSKPAFQQALSAMFVQGSTVRGTELSNTLKTDFRRWGPVVKASGFKIDE